MYNSFPDSFVHEINLKVARRPASLQYPPFHFPPSDTRVAGVVGRSSRGAGPFFERDAFHGRFERRAVWSRARRQRRLSETSAAVPSVSAVLGHRPRRLRLARPGARSECEGASRGAGRSCVRVSESARARARAFSGVFLRVRCASVGPFAAAGCMRACTYAW